MTHEQAQAWLDAYVAAWRSYDRDAVEALFTEDASPGRGWSNLTPLWPANSLHSSRSADPPSSMPPFKRRSPGAG
jgi:hypothetical protein